MKRIIELKEYSKNEHKVLMSGCDKQGNSYGVNESYFTVNGEPWLPVMGEIHYARAEADTWRERLLKMKAGGIDIVATYVFWIYHEEIEGQFIWTGRRDLRKFVELCQELDMKVLLRIGPWDHGEVRNGGYPDWLLAKNCEAGYNNEEYFGYAMKLYQEIYKQVDGLLCKAGGPIIGVQIDNEYGHCHGTGGAEGIAHMKRLKKMAVEAGFDVPMYTATGWGGGVVVKGEMIPVLAAYGEGSWEQHLNPMPPPETYLFTAVRDDIAVGSDLAANAVKSDAIDLNDYPYATCEIGGGMQDSYRRRPILTADDTEMLMFAKLGSGANMIGYYMYVGGSNDIGQLTTLQETEDTGYPNNLPVISYDYQAPVGEYCQLRDSYRQLRLYHMLVHDFGKEMTDTDVIIPDDGKLHANNPRSLRFAIRHKNSSGFLFLANYQRGLVMEDKKDIDICLRYRLLEYNFKGFELASGRRLIMPFGMDLGGARLHIATAQPLCHIQSQGEEHYFFFTYEDMKAVYEFEKIGAMSLKSAGSDVTLDSNMNVTVSPGFASTFTVMGPDGRKVWITTLTRQQAEMSQKVVINGTEGLVVADCDILVHDDTMELCRQGNEPCTVSCYPAVIAQGLAEAGDILQAVDTQWGFTTCHVQLPQAERHLQVEALGEDDEGKFHWDIYLPENLLEGVHDVFLNLQVEGDVARITSGGKLLNDFFINGLEWSLSLGQLSGRIVDRKLSLEIDPLVPGAEVYREYAPDMQDGRAVGLLSAKLVVEQRKKIASR